MKIAVDTYVSIEYELKLDSGETVDESPPGESLGFVYGYEQLVPGLEKQLENLEEGAVLDAVVPPEEAYGQPNDKLFQSLPRKNLPPHLALEPGATLVVHAPHGPMPLRIKEVKDDEVIVDLNHPLAGKTLHFHVKIVEVRKATEEEIDACKNPRHEGCGHHACQGCGEDH